MVPEKYKDKLDFLYHMVTEGKVAAMEVTEKATGKPAVLLVGIEETKEGDETGYDVYPIARFDFDPNDYEGPGDTVEGLTQNCEASDE